MKNQKIVCPSCNGENIRSVDNQPLFHPSKKEVEGGTMRFDNELYMNFICDDCNHDKKNATLLFTKVFGLVVKK